MISFNMTSDNETINCCINVIEIPKKLAFIFNKEPSRIYIPVILELQKHIALHQRLQYKS